MAEYRRWNEFKHEYEPYTVPDDWYLSCYETDMDTEVNCAQCGARMHFGECYTSHQVHTEYGFGYAVCPDCYFNREVPEHDAAMQASADMRELEDRIYDLRECIADLWPRAAFTMSADNKVSWLERFARLGVGVDE